MMKQKSNDQKTTTVEISNILPTKRTQPFDLAIDNADIFRQNLTIPMTISGYEEVSLFLEDIILPDNDKIFDYIPFLNDRLTSVLDFYRYVRISCKLTFIVPGAYSGTGLMCACYEPIRHVGYDAQTVLNSPISNRILFNLHDSGTYELSLPWLDPHACISSSTDPSIRLLLLYGYLPRVKVYSIVDFLAAANAPQQMAVKVMITPKIEVSSFSDSRNG